MTNVVAIARPVAEPSIAELAILVAELVRDRDEMRARLAEVESRLPPPRSELKGWIGPKRAAHELGVSRASIYRWLRSGKLVSFKPKGFGFRIDPASVEKVRRDFLTTRAHRSGRADSE